ncbi:hypothetical protein KDK77_09480 [bacterium]|nr:hypothetical protein [bacterium]MCP5462947.1 hypothetical protein [bacterium]
MKTLVKTTLLLGLSVILSAGVIFSNVNRAYAGDREWATVGKILTGVLGTQIIYDINSSGHHSGYSTSYRYSRYHSYHAKPRYYAKGHYHSSQCSCRKAPRVKKQCGYYY